MTLIERGGAVPARLPDLAGPAGTPSNGALTQVFPPRTPVEMAARALATLDQERISEGLEDAALGLGGRLRNRQRDEKKEEASSARRLLSKMSRDALGGADPRLGGLLEHYADLADAADPVAALHDAGLDSGAIALLLSAWVGMQRRGGARRARLEAALDALLETEGDWALDLLAWLEFGPDMQGMAPQLKKLYQRAVDGGQNLSQWFAQLTHSRDRKRKVKVLIRALGFELGVSDRTSMRGTRLAVTIRDLKRLLIFLGIEEQCRAIAAQLAVDAVDGERILRSVLEIVDQTWLYPEWLQQHIFTLGLDEPAGFAYGRYLAQLVQLLPDPCFGDDEQRAQVIDALAQFNQQDEAG